MAEVLKERRELDPAFQWDLTTLYADDAAWEAGISGLDAVIAKVASFAGTLKDAASVRAYLDAEEELELQLDDIFCYANLRHSEDTRAAEAQKMYSRAYGKYVEAVTATAFAEPEILALPEETLKALTEDPLLADYRFNLEKLLKRKPHTLSGSEEQLLANFGEVFAVPGEVSDNLQDADMVFDAVTDANGEEHEVTGSNYILLQTDPDRTLRENAFRSFYKGYREHNNTFAAAYSGCVKAAAAEARVRHYDSSRGMVMALEHVPVPVYDNLVDTVRAHLPAMYRYVNLRKRLLGIPDLHYYDVYAPLVEDSTEHYTYEQAQQMVLDAVAPLGEDYVKSVQGAYDARWIDVYPNKGKSGGAYSSGTYRSNPFILTNFTGTLDSVSTIAHEMGHSQHTKLANRHQPPQYAGYTLFVAEVASTVNENLLVADLLSKTDDPKVRLRYLNQSLEAFKGTVYRQTMFAEFEREAHAKAERGEPLDPGSLNELYLGLVKDYFGPELVLDDEIQYEWSRIPHFYRPFYVYKYATSYCSAMALSEAILAEGEPARNRYLEFLSMGGSRYPLDELKHAGVDLTTPDPIDRALDKFEAIVAEAEVLADELGL